MRTLCHCVLVVALFVAPAVVVGGTIRVHPDSLSIQEGIDTASAGDTVLAAAGTYLEHELIMKAGVTLRGETGDPSDVIIDAQQLGTVIRCTDLQETAHIEGFTLTGGESQPGGGAGGINCLNSTVVVDHCRFEDMDTSSGDAGGMLCGWSTATLTFCAFYSNSGFHSGAFFCTYSSVRLVNCTFCDNASHWAEGCLHFNLSDVVIEGTIIAYTTEGQAIYCSTEGNNVEVSCSDIYGNAGGDWNGVGGFDCIGSQYGEIRCNFSAAPLFNNRATGDLTLQADSPCQPGQHPYGAGCGGIGAYGDPVASCCYGPSSGSPATWGTIKALYR